jgi:hypothetical protein
MIGAKEPFQAFMADGLPGFHFVILREIGYSAAFPETWPRNGVAEEVR